MAADPTVDPSGRADRSPAAPDRSPRVMPLAPAIAPTGSDPALIVLTCANCGATMLERRCKLICRCGYFLSCSDYY